MLECEGSELNVEFPLLLFEFFNLFLNSGDLIIDLFAALEDAVTGSHCLLIGIDLAARTGAFFAEIYWSLSNFLLGAIDINLGIHRVLSALDLDVIVDLAVRLIFVWPLACTFKSWLLLDGYRFVCTVFASTSTILIRSLCL